MERDKGLNSHSKVNCSIYTVFLCCESFQSGLPLITVECWQRESFGFHERVTIVKFGQFLVLNM